MIVESNDLDGQLKTDWRYIFTMKRAHIALLFLILGIVLVPAAGWLYLHFGRPPVAVADPMLPGEEEIARSTLLARVDAERPRNNPVPINEATLQEGASIYMSECAFCHGVPAIESQVGVNTFPKTPQFFRHHATGNRPPDSANRAAAYHWFVENGVRLTAMPSFKHVLTDREQWEVANLLAVSETPLPESVKKVLAGSAD